MTSSERRTCSCLSILNAIHLNQPYSLCYLQHGPSNLFHSNKCFQPRLEQPRKRVRNPTKSQPTGNSRPYSLQVGSLLAVNTGDRIYMYYRGDPSLQISQPAPRQHKNDTHKPQDVAHVHVPSPGCREKPELKTLLLPCRRPKDIYESGL